MAFTHWRSLTVAVVVLTVCTPKVEGQGYFCGPRNLRGTQGHFTTPGYTRGLHYGGGYNCTYHITAPEGTTVRFRLLDFSMEPGTERNGHLYCDNDYLEIFDGDNRLANTQKLVPLRRDEESLTEDYSGPFRMGEGRRLCGEQQPPPFWSSSNVVSFVFRSNLHTSESDTGFKATWRTYIGKKPFRQEAFTIQPEEQSIFKGEDTNFVCHITDPGFAVVWLKDGLPYAGAIAVEPGMPVPEVSRQHILNMREVTKQDEAWYQCIGVLAGTGYTTPLKSWLTSERVRLTVRTWFITQPANLTVHEGQPAEMRCKVTRHTGQNIVMEQRVFWLKNAPYAGGEEGEPNQNGEKNLIIPVVTTNNEGWYQCYLQGTITYPGSTRQPYELVEYSKWAYLGVIVPPDTPALNWYGEAMNNEHLDLGDNIGVKASITRRGNPFYKFYQNGVIVAEGYDDTYVIESLAESDMGRYTATASFGSGGRESGVSNPIVIHSWGLNGVDAT